jgi:hypothetical protein
MSFDGEKRKTTWGDKEERSGHGHCERPWFARSRVLTGELEDMRRRGKAV